jgi:hypothetical protein
MSINFEDFSTACRARLLRLVSGMAVIDELRAVNSMTSGSAAVCRITMPLDWEPLVS